METEVTSKMWGIRNSQVRNNRSKPTRNSRAKPRGTSISSKEQGLRKHGVQLYRQKHSNQQALYTLFSCYKHDYQASSENHLSGFLFILVYYSLVFIVLISYVKVPGIERTADQFCRVELTILSLTLNRLHKAL